MTTTFISSHAQSLAVEAQVYHKNLQHISRVWLLTQGWNAKLTTCNLQLDRQVVQVTGGKCLELAVRVYFRTHRHTSSVEAVRKFGVKELTDSALMGWPLPTRPCVLSSRR